MSFRYEEQGVDLMDSVAVAPEGIYTLIIVKASDVKDGMPRINKNGDNYVSVEAEIDEGSYLGKKVWTNINFMKNGPDGKPKKGASLAIRFLKAINEPWEPPFDVVPENWIGKRLKAKLIISKDQKNRDKNEIAYLVNEDSISNEVPF